MGNAITSISVMDEARRMDRGSPCFAHFTKVLDFGSGKLRLRFTEALDLTGTTKKVVDKVMFYLPPVNPTPGNQWTSAEQFIYEIAKFYGFNPRIPKQLDFDFEFEGLQHVKSFDTTPTYEVLGYAYSLKKEKMKSK